MNHQRGRLQASPEENVADLGGEVHEAETVQPKPIASLWCDDGSWSEAEIPRRRWIAPGYLLRGAVTIAAGSAGVSKSSIACCYTVALALGRPFHRFTPVGRMRVLLYNVEDDMSEQRRRLSAALRDHGAQPADLAGRVLRLGPNGVGTLLALGEGGKLVETPVWKDLMERIKDFRPDVVILDPFVELHGVEENDNGAVRSVMAKLRSLAVEFDLALVLVHHARKGQQVAGDPDGARGASAIIGAARIALTVTPMHEEEAKAFGLDPEARRHLFRVDGSKSNYAPLTSVEWFERISCVLDNGDHVASPRPWTPPVDIVAPDARAAIEAGIAAGSATGPWSPKLSNDARSLKCLMARNGVTTTAGQKQLLGELLTGGHTITPFRRANRGEAQGLRAPDGRPTSVVWVE